MKFNWETFVSALVQLLPGLFPAITTALKGSTSAVHSQAVASAANSIAVVSGATPEQAQAAGTLAAAIHAQTVAVQASTAQKAA